MKLLDYYELRRQEKVSWNFAAVEQDAAFLERLDAMLPNGAERFSGHLVKLDIGPLFEKLRLLCQLYREATADQRTYMRSRVDFKLDSQLGSFGLLAAVAGARERTPDMVALGLAAYALADIVRDVREVLMSLSVMFRCAELSGADAVKMFQEAAAISGPAMSAVFLDFAARHPDLRDIRMMGWREVETPEGVGFVFAARGAPKSEISR